MEGLFFLLGLCLLFGSSSHHVDHPFASIGAAFQAGSMTQVHLSAISAAGKTGALQSMVRTAVAGRCSRMSHSDNHIGELYFILEIFATAQEGRTRKKASAYREKRLAEEKQKI